MNILFLGDIFGEVGRDLVKTYLPKIKENYQIDYIIANGENATHGRGISKSHYDDLLNEGINCLTMGNHTFDRADMLDWINHANFLVRPANLSRYTPGVGSREFTFKDKKIRVTNIIGRVFMDGIINNPYESMDDILLEDNSDIHIVDFHGEATAEKIAFGYNYDGIVSAVVGTHTHVQTADERILDKNTGYISDVGMCGPFNECIGMDKKNVMYKMKTSLPARFEIAEGKGNLCGVVLSFNDDTNRLEKIERINLSPINNYQF